MRAEIDNPNFVLNKTVNSRGILKLQCNSAVNLSELQKLHYQWNHSCRHPQPQHRGVAFDPLKGCCCITRWHCIFFVQCAVPSSV